jgi:hypothetical protein
MLYSSLGQSKSRRSIAFFLSIYKALFLSEFILSAGSDENQSYYIQDITRPSDNKMHIFTETNSIHMQTQINLLVQTKRKAQLGWDNQ